MLSFNTLCTVAVACNEIQWNPEKLNVTKGNPVIAGPDSCTVYWSFGKSVQWNIFQILTNEVGKQMRRQVVGLLRGNPMWQNWCFAKCGTVRWRTSLEADNLQPSKSCSYSACKFVYGEEKFNFQNVPILCVVSLVLWFGLWGTSAFPDVFSQCNDVFQGFFFIQIFREILIKWHA